MEKTTYTNADRLTPLQASKRYNLDRAKAALLMKELYDKGKKIPGKPLKHIIERDMKNHKKFNYKLSPHPDAHIAYLAEYKKMFDGR